MGRTEECMNAEKFYGNLPSIETERLILRGIKESDAEDLFAYASEPKVSRFMPWAAHRTIEDSKAFITFVLNAYRQKNKLTWAIELKTDRKMIGTIDFVKWLPKHARAEIAYTLSDHHWGQGLTAEAVKALAEFGFTEMQLNKIEAPIVPENVQSQRVLEKVGMKLEGVARQHFRLKGELVDLAQYSMLKEEF
ncbi:GNAT family N-acetyltransferase [Planococcus ruber]|uniref:GNAT family N-acetyltransferase n=1 Tax=Planococcus ruber TaxID=2027871 RepID=UPI001FF05E83|nr:GNAT family N-acetyltransferase [Planococcus ruber]MCJ1909013.1 GNAT family N-acetyltransferase [Planococcus ruber]